MVLYEKGSLVLRLIPPQLLHYYLLTEVSKYHIQWNCREVLIYLIKAMFSQSGFNLKSITDRTHPENVKFLKAWKDAGLDDENSKNF